MNSKKALFLLLSIYVGCGWNQALAQFNPPAPTLSLKESRSGEFYTDMYGRGLANAGDLNGDGIADILIGAPGPVISTANTRSPQSYDGRIALYDGSNGAKIRERLGRTDETLGFSVASLGDVTGDGVADYVVGAPAMFTGNAITPRAIVLDGANGALVQETTGYWGDNLGFAVANAGDLNGDGVSEALVSATYYFSGGIGYVLVWDVVQNQVLHTFYGENYYEVFGMSVTGRCDVNGDGTPDILVGQVDFGAYFPESHAKISIYSGTDFTLIREITPQAPPNTTIPYLGSEVACAGDVNGDGHDDILAVDMGEINPADPSTTAPPSGAAYLYDGMTGAVLMHWYSSATIFDNGGVATAGDVDRDGVVDFFLGLSDTVLVSGRTGSVIQAFSPKGGGIASLDLPASSAKGRVLMNTTGLFGGAIESTPAYTFDPPFNSACQSPTLPIRNTGFPASNGVIPQVRICGSLKPNATATLTLFNAPANANGTLYLSHRRDPNPDGWSYPGGYGFYVINRDRPDTQKIAFKTNAQGQWTTTVSGNLGPYPLLGQIVIREVSLSNDGNSAGGPGGSGIGHGDVGVPKDFPSTTGGTSTNSQGSGWVDPNEVYVQVDYIPPGALEGMPFTDGFMLQFQP